MSEITPELIGTLGFPVAVTVYLLWERRSEKKEDRIILSSALDKLSTAVDNNTIVLTRVCEKLNNP